MLGGKSAACRRDVTYGDEVADLMSEPSDVADADRPIPDVMTDGFGAQASLKGALAEWFEQP
jgi:hypothetical protein